MSERTDMKNKIPEYKLEDKSLVHRSKRWLNHFGETLRYLLNKSLTSKNSTISLNDDWDKLEPNTISQVDSWKGKNAPELQGPGVVVTLSNDDGFNDYQFAIGNGKLASRIIGKNWSYTNGNDYEQISSLASGIQGLANNVNNTESSMTNSTNLIFSYMNKYADIASNSTSSLSNSTSNDEASNISSFFQQSSAINSLNDTKEDKVSANNNFKEINQELATKETTLNGPILNTDLNKDTKVGNYVINRPTELRHDPHTTFKHHDVGFLQVRNVGDNDLMQVLYLALGDPNNKVGSNTNLDGNGSISYRFMFYYPKQNSAWQPWHTVPYQSDLNKFESQTASNFAQNSDSISSYVDSLNDHLSSDHASEVNFINSNANDLRNYADSESEVAQQHTDINYSNATSKETSDFDQITNQMNSMTSSARSETAVQASIEASNLINSFNSASGSMTGQLQGALINFGTFENNVSATNKNTQGQITSLGNNISNNYNELSNATNQLGSEVPSIVSNSINNNNVTLNTQWSSELSNNNNNLAQSIAAGDHNVSSAATSYTQSVGSDNYRYTNSQTGSIDTRLWGLSNEINGPSFKAPASETSSIANQLSGINLSSISNQLTSINSQIASQESVNALNASKSYTPLGNSSGEYTNWSEAIKSILINDYPGTVSKDDIGVTSTINGTFYSLSGQESYDATSNSIEIKSLYAKTGTNNLISYPYATSGVINPSYNPGPGANQKVFTSNSESITPDSAINKNALSIISLASASNNMSNTYVEMGDSSAVSNYYSNLAYVNIYMHPGATSNISAPDTLYSLSGSTSYDALSLASQSVEYKYNSEFGISTDDGGNIDYVGNSYETGSLYIPFTSAIASNNSSIVSLDYASSSAAKTFQNLYLQAGKDENQIDNINSNMFNLQPVDMETDPDVSRNPGLYIFSINIKNESVFVNGIRNNTDLAEFNIDPPLDAISKEPSNPLNKYQSDIGFLRIYKDPLDQTNDFEKCNMYFFDSSSDTYIKYTYMKNVPLGVDNSSGYDINNSWYRVKPAP